MGVAIKTEVLKARIKKDGRPVCKIAEAAGVSNSAIPMMIKRGRAERETVEAVRKALSPSLQPRSIYAAEYPPEKLIKAYTANKEVQELKSALSAAIKENELLKEENDLLKQEREGLYQLVIGSAKKINRMNDEIKSSRGSFWKRLFS